MYIHPLKMDMVFFGGSSGEWGGGSEAFADRAKAPDCHHSPLYTFPFAKDFICEDRREWPRMHTDKPSAA